MEDTGCISKGKNGYNAENVDEFIRNRSELLDIERKKQLFKKFQKTREFYLPKRTAHGPKLSLKVFSNDEIPDDKNKVSWSKTSHNNKPKVVIKDKKQIDLHIPIHMHFEKSYIQVPDNCIKIEGDSDEIIKKLVKEGRRKFSKENGNELVLSSIQNTIGVSQEYIRTLLSDLGLSEKSKKSPKQPTACTPICYKVLNGEHSGFMTISVADQTQIKMKLLVNDNNNFCTIARELGQSCNEVYKISKIIDARNMNDFVPRPKKIKVLLKDTYNLFKKRDDLYTGFPAYYEPCNHEGECDANCPCFIGKNFCEKFCGCSNKCQNSFHGCVCKAKCETKSCPCFAAYRECQEGLCVCKSDCCLNMKISKYEAKKLDIKRSTVSGYGAFASSDIKKGDFIIEYSGELITQEEAERRGKFYDEKRISYIFDLSKDYAIDALFIGNESRYVNHSETPNCTIRIVSVYGDRRIGFFAERHIKKGEELFFDYKYSDIQKEIYFK